MINPAKVVFVAALVAINAVSFGAMRKAEQAQSHFTIGVAESEAGFFSIFNPFRNPVSNIKDFLRLGSKTLSIAGIPDPLGKRIVKDINSLNAVKKKFDDTVKKLPKKTREVVMDDLRFGRSLQTLESHLSGVKDPLRTEVIRRIIDVQKEAKKIDQDLAEAEQASPVAVGSRSKVDLKVNNSNNPKGVICNSDVSVTWTSSNADVCQVKWGGAKPRIVSSFGKEDVDIHLGDDFSIICGNFISIRPRGYDFNPLTKSTDTVEVYCIQPSGK